MDDILLIGNDMGMLSTINVWLANTFDMKDLGEVRFILALSGSEVKDNGIIPSCLY